MQRVLVRAGLRPIIAAAAALVVVLFEWPSNPDHTDDMAPRRNALAIRSAHSHLSARTHVRDRSAEAEGASPDAAPAAARAAQTHGQSVAERFASVVRRIGEEEEAALSGSAVTALAAVDVEEPPEAPPMVPRAGDRTAIYDIAAHAVYLPNGDKLEAHSGLGPRLDDPRSVNVKNRGSTPPNVYDLALRKPLFHGVRAIRLTPVDEGKMFGRDGILAHPYMHGSDGQSNGCVVFRDYPAFLDAFLRGDVERLVVVERLEAAPIAPAGVTAASVASPSPVRRFR